MGMRKERALTAIQSGWDAGQSKVRYLETSFTLYQVLRFERLCIEDPRAILREMRRFHKLGAL